MAKHTSERLTETYRFPNMAQLHLKVRSSAIRKRWREVLRSVLKSPVAKDQDVSACVSENFKASADEFRKNHWAYVDNFWEPEFHNKLLQHWPADRFFNPIRFVTKSYDTGFAWSHTPDDPPLLDQFPAYKAAYDYLRSEEFCRQVSHVAGDGVERVCYKLIMTRAYWGTSIIPHVDSANELHSVNVVMFIDGSGGERGGGLGIWSDNEFKQPIFVPEELRNTCVFYDMSESFYHGFPPMRFGSFRWTINATYEKR